MKKKLFLFCIIILFLISVIFLYSEVVVLKNGDVIRGKLIKMDEDTMTVLAKYGEIVIDRDDIESIYSDEEAYKEKQTTTKSNIVEKGKKNNIEMIFVNGGTFIMGDTFSDGKKDETPVHNVAVNDYYIGKYEVTVEEFDEYCDEFRYKRKSDSWPFTDSRFGVRDFKRPVCIISWYDAVDYCNWLSEKEGLVPCYTIDKKNIDPNNKDQRDKTKWKVECNFNANGYRLPTEAEWEYAARGGDKSKGYEYAGSNNAKEYAIYSIIVSWWPEVFHTITYSVGSKKPNELGLYDMSGHVWEWCWDWYDKDYYKESSKENPLGPESGKTIVLRGGAWNSHPVDICVSNRKAAAQNDGYIDWTMGFRVARSAK